MLKKAKEYQENLVKNLEIVDKSLRYLQITQLNKAQKETLKKAIDALRRIS